MGLGLSICKSIIEAHGGKIWADNNPGKKAQAGDNFPLGRKPAVIVDDQYPASYFPNTELLGRGLPLGAIAGE